MVDMYIGQIFLGAFNFAPAGSLPCNGQLLSIAQHAALFSLLGTSYGGNGIETFGLPNLQGTAPIGVSPTLPIGTGLGSQQASLTLQNLPAHTHTITDPGHTHGVTDPQHSHTYGGVSSQQPPIGGQVLFYGSDGTTSNPIFAATPDTSTESTGVSVNSAQCGINNTQVTGGNQPFNIMQPSLSIGYYICIQGIYPQRQ